MGCNPSKADNGPISAIQPAVSPSIPLLSLSDLSQKHDYPSYLPPASTRNNTVKRSGRGSGRGGRSNTTKPTSKRFSVSPIERNDFWGTMPLSLLIDRFNNYRDEVNRSKETFQECIEYIQNILLDLINNFETSQYRVIKKNNSKFKQMVGKYAHGINFLKALGFREKDEILQIDEKLSVVNLKNRVKDLEMASKRDDLKSVKSLGMVQSPF